MDIDEDLEDNEIFELSRSQILEISGIRCGYPFSLRNAAGLRRDFAVPGDFVDGFSYGIDVSHWDGVINWYKVADASPDYVYIKATQGGSYTDPRFDTNALCAIFNGLTTGYYHFMSANTALQSQVDNFLRCYEPFYRDSDYPPCMDLEWDYNSAGVDRWSNKSREFISDKVLGWMEAIEVKLGISPIVYTNKLWWDSRLGDDNRALIAFGVWMSRYGDYGNDAPPIMNDYSWVMWQFTDRGSICGISGGIDVSLSAPWFAWSTTAPTHQ